MVPHSYMELVPGEMMVPAASAGEPASARQEPAQTDRLQSVAAVLHTLAAPAMVAKAAALVMAGKAAALVMVAMVAVLVMAGKAVALTFVPAQEEARVLHLV